VPHRVGVTFGPKSNRTHYRTAVQAAGLEPVDITPEEPRDSLDGLNGLVLSGGADYGQDPERDHLERVLFEMALEADLPVFGICRGLQMMNHISGGTLLEHIPGHRGEDVSEKTVKHRIRVARGSLLASIVGEELEVNSRHHQAIDRVADSLTLTALAEDGVREGAERRDRRWVLGVQWHPEEMIGEEPHMRLFRSFADAVRGVATTAR
jgi:putative glutamine amidotransferase